MRTEYRNDPTMDPSGFVLLADYVPQIVQEIRYYSTYNFIGERIDGYEEPCALLTIEAARSSTPTGLPARSGTSSSGASRIRISV